MSAPATQAALSRVTPGTPSPANRSRRAALMAYWGSRTDTAWGERVRQAVEAFCRGVVQHSEHPFTDEEIAAFNAGRPDSPPFDLERKPIAERL